MSIGSEEAGRGKLILSALRRTEIDAFKFAKAVHAGQTDKAGKPYLGHLDRVHGRVVGYSAKCPFWSDHEADEAEQIAWLHDTIEDTWVAPDTLRREGFSSWVIDAVRDLTKPDTGGPYIEWIKRFVDIAKLPAILVKLADVEDNSDPERLALLPEETQERLLRKYEPAREILKAAARAKGWQG